MQIKVVDAPCGKGKTSWAIQHMNSKPDRKFIFITPFLTEVERVKEECAGLDFRSPANESKSKSKHLKDLLEAEHNIVSTHSLFTRVDSETLELIRMAGYTLFLDEVMDVVHQETVSQHDIKMLEESGFLIIDRETGQVMAAPKADTYAGKFVDIIHKAKSGRLVCFNDTFLLWQFPPEVFSAFSDAYVLTYLFHGQIQRCYFEYHELPYTMHGVTGSRETGYSLTDHDPVNGDRELREWLKDNLKIHDDEKLNRIGDEGLSFTWYQRHANNKRVLSTLQKATYNYFRNVVNGVSAENMWTTFNMAKDALQGKGYTKGFVPHNARATNEFSHKNNLAYLINRGMQPGLVQYFKRKGISVNADLFAVSELIQWLFRSALRNKKAVNLFLPSARMRRLLGQWMEGSLA